MRRTGKPKLDDHSVIEVELIDDEPEQIEGGAADRDALLHWIRRELGRMRRSVRRRTVLAVSVVVAFAVGLAGMRMWDDRAAQRALNNTVAASITLAQGGAAPPPVPVTGIAHGAIQAVVHNAGPVPFSLIDASTDVPNVRIISARVVGSAQVVPGQNGQFDISFTTDCSKTQQSDPSGNNPNGTPIQVALRVRTAARQVRTVTIPIPQPDPSAATGWSESIQIACGQYTQSPLLLAWPAGATGFPKATVHGKTATITVTVTPYTAHAARLLSFDGIPGVLIRSPNLPLTLEPDSPAVTITVVATVTDCAIAGFQPQYPVLGARVDTLGNSADSPTYISEDDGRITLALDGALARICAS